MLLHRGDILIEDQLGINGNGHPVLLGGHGDHLQGAGLDLQPGEELRHRLLLGNSGDKGILIIHGDALARGELQITALSGEELGGGVGQKDLRGENGHVAGGRLGRLHISGAGVAVSGVWRQGQGEKGEDRYCCDSDQPRHQRGGFLASFKHDT